MLAGEIAQENTIFPQHEVLGLYSEGLSIYGGSGGMERADRGPSLR